MSLLDEGWPLVLLALRIGAVGLLYLFLLTAFRTLWADLRAPTTVREPQPEAYPDDWAEGWPEPAYEDDLPPLPAAGAAALPRTPARAPLPDEWETPATGSTAAPRARRTPGARRVPPRVALPAAAAITLVVLGGVAAFAGREPPGETATTAAPTSEPFGPPAVAPAAGRVTVGLAAPEDSQVRVTVDGVVQFDGTLRAGQRQAWEGGERIQVWTDNGKVLLLAVNGRDLGPYSPAMGHPDWNRIDFGFWPGWAQ